MICWNQSCSCNSDFPSHLYNSSVITCQAPTSHSLYPFSLVSVFPLTNIRGVLGNKCAGQHNLKTVHFREIFASGNFLAWFSGVCVFFYSALSTLGRQGRVFM
jgi:hypothetical protein